MTAMHLFRMQYASVMHTSRSSADDVKDVTFRCEDGDVRCKMCMRDIMYREDVLSKEIHVSLIRSFMTSRSGVCIKFRDGLLASGGGRPRCYVISAFVDLIIHGRPRSLCDLIAVNKSEVIDYLSLIGAEDMCYKLSRVL